MNTRKLLVELIVVIFISCSIVEAKEYTSVCYTVTAGDTLDSIAQTYLPADRGDSKEAFADFKEGIYEYNFDRVFVHRTPYKVLVGDRLIINFWK